jgi:hypothetical protein
VTLSDQEATWLAEVLSRITVIPAEEALPDAEFVQARHQYGDAGDRVLVDRRTDWAVRSMASNCKAAAVSETTPGPGPKETTLRVRLTVVTGGMPFKPWDSGPRQSNYGFG